MTGGCQEPEQVVDFVDNAGRFGEGGHLDLERGDIAGDGAVGDHRVDNRREDARIDARAENRRDHRDAHRQRADGEHGLAGHGDPAVLVAGQAAFGHRVLDGFPLADEIEHHHRVREQHEHRREKAERDVAADVRAAQSEHGGADEADEADTDRGEERLSQDAIIDDPPSPFVVEWLPRVSCSVVAAFG